MLYPVGTHIDLSQLNSSAELPVRELDSSNMYEPGTRIIFVKFVQDSVLKITQRPIAFDNTANA